MRILFIDDDVLVSNALSETLKEQNILVDRAESGKSGIELADICACPTIILDLVLPDLTGIYGHVDKLKMKIIHVFICKLTKKIGRETQDAPLIETV